MSTICKVTHITRRWFHRLLDCARGGVRVVASAHGDFRSLLKSPKLNTLVGGKTRVTVGDGMAIANGGSKVRHVTHKYLSLIHI